MTPVRKTADSKLSLESAMSSSNRVAHRAAKRMGTLEVLTLEEAAALLKLPADAVRSRAEGGDLPGRRFGKEWRFARMAVVAWLADGDPHERRRTFEEDR
jgi:excisionase family DNA binding protein